MFVYERCVQDALLVCVGTYAKVSVWSQGLHMYIPQHVTAPSPNACVSPALNPLLIHHLLSPKRTHRYIYYYGSGECRWALTPPLTHRLPLGKFSIAMKTYQGVRSVKAALALDGECVHTGWLSDHMC